MLQLEVLIYDACEHAPELAGQQQPAPEICQPRNFRPCPCRLDHVASHISGQDAAAGERPGNRDGRLARATCDVKHCMVAAAALTAHSGDDMIIQRPQELCVLVLRGCTCSVPYLGLSLLVCTNCTVLVCLASGSVHMQQGVPIAAQRVRSIHGAHCMVGGYFQNW